MKTPQEIFESELDIEAKRIFCALPEEERRRIVAVRFPPTLKDADEDIAVLNATIYNGIIKGRLYANAEEVETFGLVDVVTSRGWVRYKDVYASPRRIESWKSIEAQEETDARDLELGRNFGATLSRIEGKVGEVGRIVVEKKAETERRLAGQTSKAIELDRKLKLAEAENARLRGNDTK